MKNLTPKEYEALKQIFGFQNNPCVGCSVDQNTWSTTPNSDLAKDYFGELYEKGYAESYACQLTNKKHPRVSAKGKLAMNIYEFCRLMESVEQ